MAERSVIIIGAGLAGLAAGVYAQRNGYDAHIFEHASGPGGVAVAWRRGSYYIDGGIHFLMGHRPGHPIHRLYEELGAAQPGMCVDMSEYGEFIDEASGRRLAVTADLDRLAADWRRLSPEDAPVMDELVRAVPALLESGGLDLGMGDPPELTGRFAMISQMWQMRRLLRYFTGSYARTAAERARDIRDPWLSEVYVNLFLPEVPVWFVAMVLGLLSSGGMGLLKSGSAGFVQPIESCFKSMGGQVTYNSTVERILVDHDRAVGVQLADGAERRAGAVISAADGYSTIFEMLGGRYVDAKIRERYSRWPLIRPMVMINLGVDREFRDVPHILTYQLQDPIEVGGRQVRAILLRIFNYSDHFAPAGKTVVQATFESEWDYWRNLRGDAEHNSAAYEDEKRRVAAEVLKRLEAHFPGLSDQVEITDVATPYTTWRYTRNRHGAYEGWLPTPQQMITALPRTLPGLDRFIMAGQWVIPGGGIPTCLASGRDAVRILCVRDGVKFRARE